MKQILFLILSLYGVSLFSQNINHPTIDKVQTSYKFMQQPAAQIPGQGATPNITVRAETSITLKATGVDKIYLKMMDAQNNVLYQVNYSTGAASMTDSQGTRLFYKEGNTIHIGNPNTLPLKPYQFEIYTEDSQGNASQKYTVTQ